MPKIIFNSQYMRDAPPAQLDNNVKYIAGRPRMEPIGKHGLFTDAGGCVPAQGRCLDSCQAISILQANKRNVPTRWPWWIFSSGRGKS